MVMFVPKAPANAWVPRASAAANDVKIGVLFMRFGQ
jgi:hypothetical protein